MKPRRQLASHMARIALGPCDQGISAQARPCAARATKTRCRRACSTRSSLAASTGIVASTAGGRLLTLRRLFPQIAEAGCNRESSRTPASRRENVAAELAYLDRPLQPRVRAALRLGVAAVASSRSDASRRAVGAANSNRWRAHSPSGCALSRGPDLSDPRRDALQHSFRAGPVARMGRASSITQLAEQIRDAPAALVRQPIAIARRGSREAMNSCRQR